MDCLSEGYGNDVFKSQSSVQAAGATAVQVVLS
jgi:hypothetical protein